MQGQPSVKWFTQNCQGFVIDLWGGLAGTNAPLNRCMWLRFPRILKYGTCDAWQWNVEVRGAEVLGVV